MPNLYQPEWEFEATAGEMVLRVARVVAHAGGERLGGTLYELEPGGTAVSPLHFHRANEELLLVVAGRPSIRSLEGERACEPGELVAFPAGPGGAHQILNRSDEVSPTLGELDEPPEVRPL